jgi:hypothetical protein
VKRGERGKGRYIHIGGEREKERGERAGQKRLDGLREEKRGERDMRRRGVAVAVTLCMGATALHHEGKRGGGVREGERQGEQ